MGNLKKKELEKCKHPNSRKTLALSKQVKKIAKKEKNKLEQNIKLNLIGEKLLWFQEHLILDVPIYTPDQIEELINSYLGRFDEELDQIKMKHSVGQRKNRQHASREDIINMTIKREREEFDTCGLEMPDLLNAQQLEILRNWNGELRYLQNFKLQRFARKHLNTVKMQLESTSGNVNKMDT